MSAMSNLDVIRQELAASHGFDVIADWPAGEAIDILAAVDSIMDTYGATADEALTFHLLAPGEPWPDDCPVPPWYMRLTSWPPMAYSPA